MSNRKDSHAKTLDSLAKRLEHAVRMQWHVTPNAPRAKLSNMIMRITQSSTDPEAS
jgi:hypothetical protein